VFDNLSVAENILINERPRRRGLIDWKQQRVRAARLLKELDAPFEPDRPVSELSVAQKHLVQIARGISCDARVMILDEPTAALSHREVEDLYRIVARLESRGCAVLFISHKFEEVFALADRYTVFRDGAAVGAGLMRDAGTDDLIRLMVGRPVEQVFPKSDAAIGAEVLRVEHLSRGAEFADVSLSVRAGEILGVYGLVGAGRSELMQCLFGLTRPDTGRVLIDGQERHIAHPDDALRLKIAYVPEDRQHQGAILPFAIAANIALASLKPLSRFGLTQRARERALAEQWIAALQIKASSPLQAVGALSGGNQQKVVLAKWLATHPKVLILDEPTKGIDVGAKAAVHAVMCEYARQGLAVIMVSSELPEVLRLADRILVMRRGRVRALLDRAEATAERVVEAATDA